MNDEQYYSEKKDAEVGTVTVVPAGEGDHDADEYVSRVVVPSQPFHSSNETLAHSVIPALL